MNSNSIYIIIDHIGMLLNAFVLLHIPREHTCSVHACQQVIRFIFWNPRKKIFRTLYDNSDTSGIFKILYD